MKFYRRARITTTRGNCLRRAHRQAVLSVSIAIVLAGATAKADNGTWTNVTSGGLWNTGGNWTGGTIADGLGFTADFSTIDITADNTVHLDGPHTLTNLIFGDTDTGTAAGWTLDNNGVTGNVLTLAGLTPTITVNSLGTGKSVTISAVIAGTAGLTKAGAGTLVLSGANTYSGTTFINAGALNAQSATALGTGVVVNNATLNLTSAAGTTYTLGAVSGAGTINANTLGTGTATTTLGSGATNWSAYTGTINIGVGAAAGAGKAVINSGLGSGASVNIGTNATLFVSSGVSHAASLMLNGGDTGESLGQLRLEAGTNWTGAITLAGNITGAGDGFIGANTGLGIISGVIGETGGSRVLSKSGGGTTVLTGNNTFTGGSVINGGFLGATSVGNSGSNSSLGTGATINIITGTGGLLYLGTGETSDKVINYNSASAGGVVTNLGAGTLTFSNPFTTTATAAFGVTFNGTGNTTIAGIAQPATPVAINFNKQGTGGVTLTGLTNLNLAGANGNLRADGGVLNLASTFTSVSGATAMNITRAVGNGGVLKIATGASAFTSTATTNGILGGWATFGDNTWAVATDNATAITGLGSFTNDWATATGNADIITSNTSNGLTVNSLRFNTAGAVTQTLSGANVVTSGGILVTSAVGANDVTITGGTSIQAGVTNGDLIVFQNNSGGSLNLNSVIAANGTGGLTKAGAGALILGGANLYTGTTFISEGLVKIGIATALGSVVGGTNVAAGATLDLNGQAIAGEGLTLSGAGISGNGNLINSSGAAASVFGNVSLANNAVVGGSGSITLGGVISSAGTASLNFGLTKTGTGTVTLSGANTYNGDTAVSGGSLNLAHSLALQNSTLTTGGITFDASVPSHSFYIGQLKGSFNLTLADSASNPVAIFPASNGLDSSFSGAISGAGSLVKIGGGTLTLTGNNTYTGGTVINTGTLVLAGSTASPGTTTLNRGTLILDYSTNNNAKLGAGAVTLNGGTLTLSGGTFSETVSGVNVNGAASITRLLGSSTIALGAITRNAGGLLDVGNTGLAATTTPNVNGVLRGVTIGGALAANDGSGNIVAYTGFADVSRLGGTITSAAASNVRIVEGGSAGNVTLGAGTTDINTLTNAGTVAGTTVDLGSGSNILRLGTVGTIVSGASGLTISGAGTTALTAGGADNTAGEILVTGPGTTTISSLITNNGSGAVAVSKAGAGSMTLSGTNNTYSGGTFVNAGTLTISGAGGIGTGALTIGPSATITTSGGNFRIDGNTATSTRVVNIAVGGTLNLAGGEYIRTINLTGATVANASGGTDFLRATGTGLTINALFSHTGSTVSKAIDLTNSDLTLDVADGPAATDLTISGGITENTGSGSGAKSVTKIGAGTLVLSGASGFTGAVNINGGTVSVTGTNTRLGSNTTPGRVITVGPGCTLFFGINNVFGGSGQTLVNTPSIVLNGATLSANRYNVLGNVTLNGGTITQSTTDSGNYQGYEFNGSTVTVTGSTPSLMTFVTGANGMHLAGNKTTTFDVADVTGNANADLIVSAALVNGSGDRGGAGALLKTGAGTMHLAAANSYTGTTTINAGTLNLAHSLALQSTTVTFNGGGVTFDQSVASNAFTFGALAGFGNLVLNNNAGSPAPITLTTGGNNGNTAFSGVISGGGALAKTGNGTLILQGSNTFTGTMSIQNGTVSISSIGNSGVAGNIGAGSTISLGSGGTQGILTYTGSGETTNRVFNFAGTTGGATINANGTGLLKFTGTTTTTAAGAKGFTFSGIGSGEIDGAIVNNGGLLNINKTGTGTWSLKGGLTLGGGTITIGGGRLNLDGTNTGAAASNVNSGGTLNLTGSLDSAITVNSGGTLTGSGAGSTSGLITLNTGSTLLIGTGGFVTGNGVTAVGVNGVNLTPAASSIVIGANTLDVIGYGAGAAPDLANFNTAVFRSASLANVAGNKTQLTFTAASRSWNNANVTGVWEVDGTSTNWVEGDQKFFNGDAVTFGDITADTVVTLSGRLFPSSVIVNNAANTYTLSGVSGMNDISGTTSLVKNGAGTVILDSTHSFTGGVTVNAGILVTNAGNSATGTLGSNNVTINNGGTIQVGGDNSLMGFGVDPGKTITINAGGTLANLGGSTNHLTFLVLNGGTLSATTVNTTYASWNFDYGISTPGTGGSNSFITGGNVAMTQTGGTKINVQGTDTLTISSVIADVPGLTETELIKTGTGTLILSGNNTFNTPVTIAAGTLTVGDGGTLGTGAAANFVTNNATLAFNRSDAVTIPNVISGPGVVTQMGTGATTLSGINTYTGPTNVNTGKLYISGSLAAASAVSVANGATFGGNGSAGSVTIAAGGVLDAGIGGGNSGIGSITLGNLTFSASGSINFGTLAQYTSVDAVIIGGAFTALGPTGSITINLPTAGTASNTYKLIANAGSQLTKFALGTTPALSSRQSGSLQNVSGSVAYVVVGDTPRWTGKDGNSWVVGNTGTNGNWQLITGGTKTDYIQGDTVTFDDNATSTVVDISVADVQPGVVTFNHSSKNYTLQGSKAISGASFLAKSGTGTLTINNANTYTGGTNLNGGTLVLGNADAIGSTGTISFGGGVLQHSAANTTDYSSRFATTANQAYNVNTNGQDVTWATGLTSSGGTLTKSGNGALSLDGANTYTGLTTINAGTVKLGTATSLGTTAAGTTIASGATLDLNGQAVGAEPVTVGGNGVAGGGALINSSGAAASLGGTITLTSTMTIGGTGDMTLSGTVSGTGELIKAGTGTVGFSGGGTALPNLVTVSSGTVRLLDSLFGGDKMTGNGVLTVNSGGAVEFAGFHSLGGSNGGMSESVVVNGGTITMTHEQYFNNLTLNGGTINGPSEIRASNASNWQVTGTSPSTISANVSLVNAGNFNVGNATGDAAPDLIVSGEMKNTGAFNKSGAGTMQLAGSNTYSGVTTISAGTLVVGDGATSGTLGSGNVTNNAALVLNRSDDVTIANIISGTGTLTHAGTGTTILTGTHPYTGGTTVQAGRLLVNGSITGSMFTVNGGTIGGTGTLGSILVNSGGNFAPGDSIGTINVNTLTLTTLAIATFEIDKTGLSLTNDVANIVGSLLLGGTLKVTATGDTLAAGDAFDLFNAGSTTGMFTAFDLPTLANGLVWDTSNIPVNGVISVAVVPEPGSIAAILGGAGLLLGMRRRRK